MIEFTVCFFLITLNVHFAFTQKINFEECKILYYNYDKQVFKYEDTIQLLNIDFVVSTVEIEGVNYFKPNEMLVAREYSFSRGIFNMIDSNIIFSNFKYYDRTQKDSSLTSGLFMINIFIKDKKSIYSLTFEKNTLKYVTFYLKKEKSWLSIDYIWNCNKKQPQITIDDLNQMLITHDFENQMKLTLSYFDNLYGGSREIQEIITRLF